MTNVLAFNIILAIGCGYALIAGGAPERAAAAVFALAAAASYLAPYSRFFIVELPLFSIDVVTFLALTVIACVANRFWPLYVAAIQLLTVAIHAVKAYDPALAHWMYGGASGKLAYPLVILLAIGVARHRDRVARFGRDRPWSTGVTATP